MASIQYKTDDQLLNEIGERTTELLYRFHNNKSKERAKAKEAKKNAPEKVGAK